MGEDQMAKVVRNGRDHVVFLPSGVCLPVGDARVTRVENGILLEPIRVGELTVDDVDRWFAKLDQYAHVPFMGDGRRQPSMPENEVSFE
jgi:virulence-associated protein VagC